MTIHRLDWFPAMITTLNIHEAKTHLSRLLDQVADGDEVVIAKNGRPVARLVAAAALPPRRPDRFRGQIRGADSLLEPGDTEEVALWALGTVSDPLRSTPAKTA